MATPATGGGNGHAPASMSERQPPHTAAIDEEPLDSTVFPTLREPMKGKLSSEGTTALRARFRQVTVSYFHGGKCGADFTSPTEKGGEVVMSALKRLVSSPFQGINALFVRGTAQRGDGKGLGFAARKDHGAVGAGQYAGFNFNGTHGFSCRGRQYGFLP